MFSRGGYVFLSNRVRQLAILEPSFVNFKMSMLQKNGVWNVSKWIILRNHNYNIDDKSMTGIKVAGCTWDPGPGSKFRKCYYIGNCILYPSLTGFCVCSTCENVTFGVKTWSEYVDESLDCSNFHQRIKLQNKRWQEASVHWFSRTFPT